ncbi:hypothetical protein GB881_12115, partial [Georgenia subflava]|nr:hypothetical protein [Georgenia subflava]
RGRREDADGGPAGDTAAAGEGAGTATGGADVTGAEAAGKAPVGDTQSSADRKPTTEADVSAETVDKDVKKEAE